MASAAPGAGRLGWVADVAGTLVSSPAKTEDLGGGWGRLPQGWGGYPWAWAPNSYLVVALVGAARRRGTNGGSHGASGANGSGPGTSVITFKPRSAATRVGLQFLAEGFWSSQWAFGRNVPNKHRMTSTACEGRENPAPKCEHLRISQA